MYVREKLRLGGPWVQLYTTSIVKTSWHDPKLSDWKQNKTNKQKELSNSQVIIGIYKLICKSLASAKVVQNVDHLVAE